MSHSSKWSSPRRGLRGPWFITNQSEAQVRSWDLWLASEVGQSCGTEPSACGIWPTPSGWCLNWSELQDTQLVSQTIAWRGKTFTHLMTRSIRSEMFSVKIKAQREERHRREELGFSLQRKEKTEFLPLQRGWTRTLQTKVKLKRQQRRQYEYQAKQNFNNKKTH